MSSLLSKAGNSRRTPCRRSRSRVLRRPKGSERGHGSALVAYACAMAFKMSREMGCVGISTYAKRDAVDYYAARGFVFFDTVEHQGAPPDAEKEMFLSLRKIETALGE
jgi:hypothetical protein